MDPADGHDLVIGGSGMLAGLVRDLAARGRQVTVIARGRERLQRLAAAPNIHPLALDYRDADTLEAGLARCVARSGPIARCVAWMHDDDLDRVLHIAGRVGDRYCQVLGSASADPFRPDSLARWEDAFAPLGKPVLRLAVLGFVLERDAARWLSDAEISAGVGRALESDQTITVVGTVTPWSRRP
jgi:NAD(P)-dependent dehydrogenase (short-subunit alcohol dehydrogenase family)